jgi:hypothetical protein
MTCLLKQEKPQGFGSAQSYMALPWSFSSYFPLLGRGIEGDFFTKVLAHLEPAISYSSKYDSQNKECFT